ncbi:hypothetical protein [Francisella salimarina]|uniref:Uncharacterized protein n=1 Tax=Francisella salimarina TaxID=2599927 RepID=A0AAJ4TLF0_9GAMM|nr:hypothetical protein [Francisella salimarina]QWU99776.1 hypothetical protein KQR59_02550 [Francisella salimarina]
MTEGAMLSAEDIQELVLGKLEEYEKLNVFEQYAMFMGKAQILEFGLKGVLSRIYGIPSESMEKWTLGQTKNKLRNEGLRPDFIDYLGRVVECRNEMAHEILLNTGITKLISNFSERKLHGNLFRAIYELEQIIILYNWCEENNGWNSSI